MIKEYKVMIEAETEEACDNFAFSDMQEIPDDLISIDVVEVFEK
tara:strand:- start:300 stop:431 length:132 start_codon:yes stop_codon:yes gene_type:complete